jgi:hypothetical protein
MVIRLSTFVTYGIARNVGIRPLVDADQAHLKVVRQSHDASDALRGFLGFILLAIASNEAGQRDDAVLHSYPDVGWIEIRGLPEFVLHVAFDFAIGSHGAS